MTTRTTTRFHGVRRAAARVMLPILASSVALGGAAVLAGTASAATTTQTLAFGATDDAYTSSSRPTYNTGSSTKLVAGRLDGNSMVTYLKFKVGTLPAGTTVQKAELVLTRDEHRLPDTVRLNKVGGTGWTESTLNNSNRPALGAVLATVNPADSAVKVAFPLGSAVKSAGTYAFAVTSPATDDVARFRSAEYSSDRPVLRLTLVKQVQSTPTTPATPAPATPAPTTPAPTTPAPTTPAPTTPPPTTPPPAECTVDAKLVPSCNILWGAAAGGFSETPRDQALREWEAKSGRVASVYHTYHRGDELFPNRAEIAMANEAGKPRLLFTNWKVNYGGKWADVAAGRYDARIDKLSAHIKANYTDTFFMTMHHEPENDVNATPGSGMTAKDFAAMFRHTVLRMRANGVTNAVFVVAYMGIEKFYNQPWWYDLYPGDDVVDWIGLDAYVASQPGGYHYGTLTDLVNRTTDRTKFPGFYNWHRDNHADKPLMLSEWGVHEYAADPTEKARTLSKVLTELNDFPNIKGMFWFDTAKDQNGADIRIDSSAQALTEFRKIAADKRFDVKVR
ncbi:MAG TPA: DNRLRE domain-containing protein [Micromonosporaceae bacterium]|nr:DNRLRE domain-containing protein [Micromonosporaceae bacterium]